MALLEKESNSPNNHALFLNYNLFFNSEVTLMIDNYEFNPDEDHNYDIKFALKSFIDEEFRKRFFINGYDWSELERFDKHEENMIILYKKAFDEAFNDGVINKEQRAYLMTNVGILFDDYINKKIK
jgi:hypothetical protein